MTLKLQVIIGLAVGVIAAAFASIEGPSYLASDEVANAPSITFLWVETFKIGFYAPAVLPLLVAFVVTTVESVGDITATVEASEMDTKVRKIAQISNRFAPAICAPVPDDGSTDEPAQHLNQLCMSCQR